MADRVNLVKNPSFESASSDWSATGAGVTVARYTSDGYSGTSSLQVTKKATTDCGAVTSTRVLVTTGLKYTMSAYVKVPAGEEASSLRVNVEWYTAQTGGSYIYMDSSTAVAVTDELGWTRLHGTFIAPATAVAALLSVTQPSAGTADETFLIDAVLFEQSNKLNAYIAPSERINLASNPSFKTNTTGWSATGSGASIARGTSDSFIDDASVTVTKGAAANCGIISSSRVEAAPGFSYSLSAYVKVPDGEESSGLVARVAWYDAVTGGAQIGSTVTSTSVTITDEDGWTRIGSTFTAPALTAACLISVVQPVAGTASETFLVDGILFEQSDYIRSYIDEPTQAKETKAVTDGFRPVPAPLITGMKLQADVSLGNLVLNTIDENNVVWVCTDISGWWNIADPEVPDIPRGYADGSYNVRGRYQARQMELTGAFFTPDPSYVAVARQKLIDAINLVYNGQWLVVNEAIPKASFVRLSGRPSIDTITARGRTEFSIGLRAGDPIKYEWNAGAIDGYNVESFVDGDSNVIENLGNIDVWPLFKVTGKVTAPATITNSTTGDVLTIQTEVRGIDTKALSFRERTGTTATLTTAAAHGLVVGDVVVVASSGNVNLNGTFTVTSVPSTTTFTYETPTSGTITSASSTGTVRLNGPDVLEIDNYNRQVSVTSDVGAVTTVGARAYLETLTDWIYLQPGNNTLVFNDTGASAATLDVYYRSGWIG